MTEYAIIKPIPLDPQGYTSNGSYYGLDKRLWCTAPDNTSEAEYIEAHCKAFIEDNQARIIKDSATGNDVWDELSDLLIQSTSVSIYEDNDEDTIRFELHSC